MSGDGAAPGSAFVLPTGDYGEPLPLDWQEPRPLALAVLDRVGLIPRPIAEDDDVDLLRVTRNACREGFSTFRGEIGPDEQRHWWAEMADRVTGYLYADRAGVHVGYGLLRQTADGRWWSSVAVLPEHAGHGYGGAITRHVIRQCPSGLVWASARNDHLAGLRLHSAEDWEVIGCDDDLTFFRTLPSTHADREGR